MLISVNELVHRWKLSPRSVLHIGAHHAEESDAYRSVGWQNVTWVEANPDLIPTLRNKVEPLGQRVIEAALWHSNNEQLSFSVASNGQSSSLLEFREHSRLYPSITVERTLTVLTRRLDAILTDDESPEFCNLDIQGAELAALRGFGAILSRVNAVYTEVNRAELYGGCAKIGEIDEYLRQEGFRRVATRWVIGFGWGDALYLRLTPKHLSRVMGFSWPLEFYLKQLPSYVVLVVRKLLVRLSRG